MPSSPRAFTLDRALDSLASYAFMIPVSRPTITETDIDAVVTTLRAGYVSGDAPIVAEFENEFAAVVGRKHGIAVSNGSVALDLALHALDLKVGDEVIVPSFTIASCLFAIMRTRATPVFADVDPVTWNMSIDTVNPVISTRTRAILLVHIYGLPVDVDPIREVCSAKNIAIVEDAAEAHTVEYKNRPCGSFGLMSTFSFYANKAITSGEGGMIVTDDDAIAQSLRQLKNLSFLPPPQPRFVHETIGWNARMSSVQAALGKSQLTRMHSATLEKRRIGLLYDKLLSDDERIVMQPTETAYSKNKYWVVGLLFGKDVNARDVARHLRERGIDSRPFFYPLHKQPLLAKFNLDQQPSLPVSELLGHSGLYLPSFVGITDAEIEFCANGTRTVLDEVQVQ